MPMLSGLVAVYLPTIWYVSRGGQLGLDCKFSLLFCYFVPSNVCPA